MPLAPELEELRAKLEARLAEEERPKPKPAKPDLFVVDGPNLAPARMGHHQLRGLRSPTRRRSKGNASSGAD